MIKEKHYILSFFILYFLIILSIKLSELKIQAVQSNIIKTVFSKSRTGNTKGEVIPFDKIIGDFGVVVPSDQFTPNLIITVSSLV